MPTAKHSNKNLRALQHARRYGIGRLLFLVRRDFLARLAVKMELRMGHALLQASAALLPFIDLQGTRSTELARRVGISKQAVGKIIQEMEALGLLTRTVDHADGRAFLVSFTETGVDYLQEMHAAINQIEQEYEAMVGAGQMEVVRAALSAIAYVEQAGGDDEAKSE
jgi:DNA-binding MarR family transcriptional regulator